MSKWRNDFCTAYQSTRSIRRLNLEIKEARDLKRLQKKVNQTISNELRDKRLREIINI